MKNIIYSLAANYKIAKGSRDRVRESRVRTPSTAQNTEKQRFTAVKSLFFFVIGTETGQNEVFVQLSIKHKPLDSNIL